MKKAVVTICFGNAYNALGEVTHPTLHAYAQRINADFHVITIPKIPNPNKQAFLYSYEKHQLQEFLLHYDRVIYLDTDIIVSSDCPDLFDVVPYSHFGAFSEGRWLERKDALAYAELQWEFLAKENVAEKWAKNYFNAGVMVIDKTHHQIFALPEVLHNNFYDQTWFNCQVAIRCPDKFQDITHAFNRMRHLDWARRLDAFIIHYAGGGVPLDQIRKDIVAWQSR
jgi:lipopolysaccharide biosynthesis glycosyltransferase